MNKVIGYSNLTYKTPFLMFVPPFQFTTTLSKEKADEFISLIMAKTGVQIFGYQRQDDEYWGRIKMNKNKTIKFTLSFKKNTNNNTTVVVNTYDSTLKESEQIYLKICETMSLFEISQSIYKNKQMSIKKN